MLLRPLLSFLSISIVTTSVGAVISPPAFTLPHLFSVDLQVTADLGAIVYPFGGGQRLNIGFVSGSMSTAANETVATVVPGLGGEQGVIREDGVLLLDVRVVLQADQSVDPDRKLAFLQARGKAVFGADGSAKGLVYMCVLDLRYIACVMLMSAVASLRRTRRLLRTSMGTFLQERSLGKA